MTEAISWSPPAAPCANRSTRRGRDGNCVTCGARAGGGTAELKARATADLLAFLGVHGFGVAKQPQASAIWTGTASRREPQARCGYSRHVNRRIFLGAAMALAAPLLGASPSLADEPLWSGSRAAEARTAALVAAIRAAGDHGLNPDWYGASVLDKAVRRPGDEKVLSDVFAAYASEVSTGRVNANRVDKDIDIQQRRVSRTDLLKAAAEAPDFAAWLAALPPKGDYPALQKVLADLRAGARRKPTRRSRAAAR